MGDNLEYIAEVQLQVLCHLMQWSTLNFNCGIKLYASEQWQRLALIQAHVLDNFRLRRQFKKRHWKNTEHQNIDNFILEIF